jgi:hypothetical protein
LRAGERSLLARSNGDLGVADFSDDLLNVLFLAPNEPPSCFLTLIYLSLDRLLALLLLVRERERVRAKE